MKGGRERKRVGDRWEWLRKKCVDGQREGKEVKCNKRERAAEEVWRGREGEGECVEGKYVERKR